MVIRRLDDGRLRFFERFRLSHFQFRLTPLRGFDGIGSRFQVSPFDEVSPALVAIGWMLELFQLFQFQFSVVLALDNFNNTGRQVGPDIVPDDGVRTAVFVPSQRESIHYLQTSYVAPCALASGFGESAQRRGE